MPNDSEPSIVAQNVPTAPEDPGHEAWSKVEPLEVFLLPQKMTTPNGGGAVQGVQVRALHDGRSLALRLTWKNDRADSTVGINKFRDSCAVMFPADPDDLPAITMGEAGKPVIVWQWKPDWENPQAQETARKQRYPEYGDHYSPINEGLFREVGDRPRSEQANVVVAEGFGTLTRTQDPDLKVRSRYEDGTWDVVFHHAMPADYPGIRPGWKGAVNVAVWDGGGQEVGARKNISLQWQSFEIPQTEMQAMGTVLNAKPMAILGGLTAAGIACVIRRRMATANEQPETPTHDNP